MTFIRQCTEPSKLNNFIEARFPRMYPMLVTCITKIKENIGLSISQIYLLWGFFHLLKFTIIVSTLPKSLENACLDPFNISQGKMMNGEVGAGKSHQFPSDVCHNYEHLLQNRAFSEFCVRRNYLGSLFKYSDAQVPSRKSLSRSEMRVQGSAFYRALQVILMHKFVGLNIGKPESVVLSSGCTVESFRELLKSTDTQASVDSDIVRPM